MDEEKPLKRFPDRSSSSCKTIEFILWNDVFLYTDEITREKIAIIVLNTQGIFNNRKAKTGNSKIISLGTFISSIQILNFFEFREEECLQHMQLATEFAKYAASNSEGMTGKCFQNLMFLDGYLVSF